MRDIDLTLRSVLSRQDSPSPPKSEKLEKMVDENYKEPGVVYGSYITVTTATTPTFLGVLNDPPRIPSTLNLTSTGWMTSINNTTMTANSTNNIVQGPLFYQAITTISTNYAYNNSWFNDPIVEKNERVRDLLRFLTSDEDSIESQFVVMKIVAHEKIEELKYRRCPACGEILFEDPRSSHMLGYHHDRCDTCLEEEETEGQDLFGDTKDDRFVVPRWGDDWRREFLPAA